MALLTSRRIFPCCLAIIVGLFSAATQAADTAPIIDFERSIVPILVRRCLGCHNASELRGGLNLTTADGLQKGGDGGTVLDSQNWDASPLLQRVAAGEMPPPENEQSRRLPEAEVAVLRRWIASGAIWPKERTLSQYEFSSEQRAGFDWWAWQPLTRTPLPLVKNPRWPKSPVDSYVMARLEQAELFPASMADARTTLRRLFFDLIGLPPTADEMDEFASNESPDAYEQTVDRLLASPRFGERWGRYWLDLVRYADTNGYERDAPKPFAWKYRDWVIRSLNSDKPYNRFVVEQLAGDELLGRSEETVTGTGLLRIGTWDDEPNDALEYKYERLEDLVHVTTTAFLGLTVKCARCHDHKFDPIPQTDYYRIAASFWAGFIEPRERELMGGPSHKELGFELLGWTDRSHEPPPLHLLKKGDPHRAEAAVPAGPLTLIPALARPFIPPETNSVTTGRRLQLAQWLVDSQQSLTPRVIVNRLWQHHFGNGLVRNPNNFGLKGERPTHPELLDWLSVELHRADWQLKPLHRLLVTSATYRQASVHPQQAEFAERDFANERWWRSERRRLDAEALRDSLLQASGRMNLRAGGPGFFSPLNREALEGLSRKENAWQTSPSDEQARRSVYMFSQRSLLLPLLTTFDFCDTTQPCGKRDVSIVATQALALMNNPFAHGTSAELATRVARDIPTDRQQQIIAIWRTALSRSPTSEEVAQAIRFLSANRDEHALAALCHVVLNTNEFLFVD